MSGFGAAFFLFDTAFDADFDADFGAAFFLLYGPRFFPGMDPRFFAGTVFFDAAIFSLFFLLYGPRFFPGMDPRFFAGTVEGDIFVAPFRFDPVATIVVVSGSDSDSRSVVSVSIVEAPYNRDAGNDTVLD